MPTRRLWQFSLRTMLLVMLVASLGLGWWAREIRRQQREREAFRLLAESHDSIEGDRGPVALIRAVNYLHSLGREEALRVIHRTEESPSSAEHQSLKYVIPLLFDRSDPMDKFPERSEREEYQLTREHWNNRILVVQDIPFITGGMVILIGRGPSSNKYLVDWAEQKGRFRSRPLCPADDIFAGADEATKRLRFPKKEDKDTRDGGLLVYWVRLQTFGAVRPLLAVTESDPDAWVPHREADWPKLAKKCRDCGIYWSDKEQNYAFRVASSPAVSP